MGIAAHDLSILASARFSLVGVDHQISRFATSSLFPTRFVHEAPFEARREASASPTS
jgi:hypothetical protein